MSSINQFDNIYVSTYNSDSNNWSKNYSTIQKFSEAFLSGFGLFSQGKGIGQGSDKN